MTIFTTEGTENTEENIFVFLRALRVLRGEFFCGPTVPGNL